MSDDREAKRDRSDVHAGRLLAIAGTVEIGRAHV